MGLSSKTGSSNFKTQPHNSHHQLLGISLGMGRLHCEKQRSTRWTSASIVGQPLCPQLSIKQIAITSHAGRMTCIVKALGRGSKQCVAKQTAAY